MEVFDLRKEQQFDTRQHVENILSAWPGADATVACWEPHQRSPYHCHPYATEIYFCFSGGGQMRTPTELVDVVPGAFVIHPPGEVHEYINGEERTLLFRVRIGDDMASRHLEWRGNPSWTQRPEDAAYYQDNPPGGDAQVS